MPKVYGYARVSTQGQNLELQLEQILNYTKYRGLELIRTFTDKASGKDTERDGFKSMIKDLEVNPLSIDAIVIYKLDRIGRSIVDLINLSRWLDEHKIGLVSITNSIDTTTKEGRLFFYILGSLAEYERELINERTALGKELARKKGVRFGRPEIKIPSEEIDKLLALGVPKTKIAKQYGTTRQTIYNKSKKRSDTPPD